jgi:thiol-disulfide isomerase/thioredoxin
VFFMLNQLMRAMSLVVIAGSWAPGAFADAPKEAICNVCRVMSGEMHEEAVRATRDYEGVTYGFCSSDCAKQFDLDPAAFVPPVFPRPAPGFELVSLAGDTLSLERLRGKVTLVDFWATWCQPCRKSMPELSALQTKLAGRGFTVLGISIDEDREKEVKRFLKKTPVTYPIAIDAKAAPAWMDYRVKAVPAAFLVDRDGKIVAQWTGRTVDAAELEARLADLLKVD